MREGPDWKPESSFRRGSPSFQRGAFLVRPLDLPFSPLAGKRLFFVSDLHVRSGGVRSFPKGASWRGTADLKPFLHAAAEKFQPDFFVFGGDLVSEAAWLDEAFSLFDGLPGDPVRLAVPGNWEYKHAWTTPDRWRQWFREAGFHFLRNEFLECGGIRFYGADDWKSGDPVFPDHVPDDGLLNVILTHNPDAVPLIPASLLKNTHLILTGHTHGGQIRLPGFGAFYCSTCVWKRFESGLYLNRSTGTRLVVSDGIGMSGVPWRLLCPPSLLNVRFVP